jgi:ectoine hydroxylase-related dioxygenase (phytanoyl-CoA dioxygenase family)
VRCPADTPVDEIVATLLRDGGVVLLDCIDPATVARLDAELTPFVESRDPGFLHHVDDFYGGNTKRIQGLAAKSPAFVESLLLNPTLLAIADGVLHESCGDYWLSQAETIYIGPGNPAQPLHRDDVNWARAASLGIPLQVSVLTALGDYDADVGATMVVPGSHRWPLDRPVDPALARPVELQPGSSLIYLGSLVHGGGWNRTADRWRKALYIGYLVGWLTPEEAVARSITAEVAARLPQRARQLLGWSSLRGTGASEGPEAALQLWQLDAADAAATDGLFENR